MASLVRLTAGTLRSALHQAASLSPRSLSSLPRMVSTNLSQSVTTTSTSPQFSTVQQKSLLSTSSLSLVPRMPLLQNVQKLAPAVGAPSCRSYHVKVSLKKRCSGCYFVRRKGRLYMECRSKPKHRQMQVMSKRKTWKEDYSEGFIQRAIHWKYNRDYHYYKLGDTPYARHDWLKGKIGVTV